MTLKELQHAYPTLPPQCRDAMRAAAGAGLALPRGAGRKLRTGLVAAILVLLLLMAASYAAMEWGILDYLLGRHGRPASELNASTQTVHAAGEADGIALTVTGAVYDGERLSLSWTVENKTPANLAAYDVRSISFGEEWVDPQFSRLSYDCWAPSAFGMEETSWPRNPVQSGMVSNPMQKALAGKQEVVLELRVSRPTRPVVVADQVLLDRLAQQEDPVLQAEARYLADTLEGAGVKIAAGDELSAACWWEKGAMVMDAQGSVLPPETMDPDDPALWEEGGPYQMDSLMKQTGSAFIRFWLDADAGLAFRHDVWARKAAGGEAQEDIRLKDCAVRMKRLSMTPLSTHIAFQMLPLENTREAAETLRETYGWLEIADENGQPLDFADMENGQGTPGLYQTESEQWVVEWDWTLPGANRVPKEIRLRMRADLDVSVLPSQQQQEAFRVFGEKMVFVEVFRAGP